MRPADALLPRNEKARHPLARVPGFDGSCTQCLAFAVLVAAGDLAQGAADGLAERDPGSDNAVDRGMIVLVHGSDLRWLHREAYSVH